MYYDAKAIHVNGARYPDTNGIDAARGAAVEARARAVPGEYERHARDVDSASECNTKLVYASLWSFF